MRLSSEIERLFFYRIKALFRGFIWQVFGFFNCPSLFGDMPFSRIKKPDAALGPRPVGVRGL
jgi:hypothetical protein